MNSKINLKDITFENVKELTETDIYYLMQELELVSDPTFRSDRMKVINSAFQFRYILPKKKVLKAELEMYGYCFPCNDKVRNSNMIVGIKRK